MEWLPVGRLESPAERAIVDTRAGTYPAYVFDHSRFYGDAGVLDLTHWAQPTYTTGDASRTAAPGTGEPVELIEPDDHYLNWLKCIRSRGTCVAPIEAGYQHAVATLMAVKAFSRHRAA